MKTLGFLKPNEKVFCSDTNKKNLLGLGTQQNDFIRPIYKKSGEVVISHFTASTSRKLLVRSQLGPFCVGFACVGFLRVLWLPVLCTPQFNGMQIRSTGYIKLPICVVLSINGCLCLC